MIRAAAKNYQDVAVVVSPADYDGDPRGAARERRRCRARRKWRLAQKAFRTTADYDARDQRAPGAGRTSAAAAARRRCDVRAPKLMDLRYGENPHQSAALYGRRGAGIAGAEQLHGKELSYNNLVDLDAAWQLVCEFDGPAVGDHQAHQSVRLRRAGHAGRERTARRSSAIRSRRSAA